MISGEPLPPSSSGARGSEGERERERASEKEKKEERREEEERGRNLWGLGMFCPPDIICYVISPPLAYVQGVGRPWRCHWSRAFNPVPGCYTTASLVVIVEAMNRR